MCEIALCRLTSVSHLRHFNKDMRAAPAWGQAGGVRWCHRAKSYGFGARMMQVPTINLFVMEDDALFIRIGIYVVYVYSEFSE